MEYKFKEYKKSKILRNHLKMGGKSPSGEEIAVNSLYIERNKKPYIGVMGEYHFVRAKREEWYEELLKMKAGGITIVATYLFWIYHEEEEGVFDFSGDRDIRQFILDAKRAGLDAVIRIGPWAHGECRNGGFPDWLLKKPYKIRCNGAEYMEKARIWYQKIYDEVEGLFFKDGGNIIGVQIENELVDDGEHLLALKNLAVEIGYDVPIYTVTGWNSAAGAKIPVDDVLPVFGGYCEAPWEGHTNRLLPSSHYFFNRMRNDSAIGTDLIAKTIDDGWQLPYERYPFATCELGGGIEVTHHRRPIIKGMDIYAVSLIKLGCGNNLIGYYMYHGGTNKVGKFSTLNETKATGYPNDYPILSYDFQTALSQYGEVREQYRLLNLLHLFVNDFADVIAPMEAVDAKNTVLRDDKESLRYGLRTDGKGGFVFINHYQRLDKLKDIDNVVIDTGNVKFPPIDIKGDLSFFMPYNMKLGNVGLEYATTQPLCKCGDTYFFMEINGIKPQYKFSDGEIKEENVIDKSGIKIVTVSYDDALYLRKLSGKVYIGNKCDLYEDNGEIKSIEPSDYSYRKWDGEEFGDVYVKSPFNQARLTLTPCSEPFEPKYEEELNIGCARERQWMRLTVSGSEGMVEISYTGDVAQIYADGKMVADEFYKGLVWRVPAKLLYDKECYMVVSELKDDFYKEF